MNFGIFKRENDGEKKTLDDFMRDERDEEVVEGKCDDGTTDNVESDGCKSEKVSVEIKEKFSVTPLDCFGWKRGNTDKWLIKCAKVWYLVISFLWFILGAITFAPIIFISSKVSVLCKDKKTSLVVGTILYVIIVALIVIAFSTRGSTTDITTI